MKKSGGASDKKGFFTPALTFPKHTIVLKTVEEDTKWFNHLLG